jgi:hypothetical protein
MHLAIRLRFSCQFMLGLALLGWLLLGCSPSLSIDSLSTQPSGLAHASPISNLISTALQASSTKIAPQIAPTSLDLNCLPKTPTPTPLGSTSTPPLSSSELTYEENLRINPPAPTDLWATDVKGGLFLCWQAPPVVVGNTYGDTPRMYKIYRRSANSDFALLAQTKETHYLDASASSGVEYRYMVSAVYDNQIEGSRSSEVRMTKP